MLEPCRTGMWLKKIDTSVPTVAGSKKRKKNISEDFIEKDNVIYLKNANICYGFKYNRKMLLKKLVIIFNFLPIFVSFSAIRYFFLWGVRELSEYSLPNKIRIVYNKTCYSGVMVRPSSTHWYADAYHF